MKIVILGSCRYEPYEVIFTPIRMFPNTEEGYQEACKRTYPAIDESDEAWVYVPDYNLGEHTRRDVEYALAKGKVVRLIQVRLTKRLMNHV